MSRVQQYDRSGVLGQRVLLADFVLKLLPVDEFFRQRDNGYSGGVKFLTQLFDKVSL